MASEIKSDKLSPSTGTSLQIGDASDTITIPTGATFTVTDGIGVASGGTGLASFTAGDILYATGSTTLAKLAKGTAEQVLAMNSGATAPDWGSVDLTALPTITVAKGGTNLASFTAGDILYATGSTTLAKLAKGTTLQHLRMNAGATAPEWTAAPSGGAWTLIKSQSITSSTADMEWIDGTDDVVLDNTYKCYVLLMTDYLAENDESSMDLHISTDTGSTYITSGYASTGSGAYFDGSSTSGENYTIDATSMVTRNHIGNAASEMVQGQIWIYNPSNAASLPTMGWNFYFSKGGGDMCRPVNGVGGYRTATAYDAFKIIPDSGEIINLQASLYGITT